MQLAGKAAKGPFTALFKKLRILKFKSQLTVRFRSVLCVSVFQGSLLVIVIMINGSEKRNCEGGF